MFWPKSFRSQNNSTEHSFGRKDFRPKHFPVDNVFGRNLFWPKNFPPKNFGRKHFWSTEHCFDQKEIDQIAAEAWGTIYAGNAKDQEALVKNFVDEYRDLNQKTLKAIEAGKAQMAAAAVTKAPPLPPAGAMGARARSSVATTAAV